MKKNRVEETIAELVVLIKNLMLSSQSRIVCLEDSEFDVSSLEGPYSGGAVGLIHRLCRVNRLYEQVLSPSQLEKVSEVPFNDEIIPKFVPESDSERQFNFEWDIEEPVIQSIAEWVRDMPDEQKSNFNGHLFEQYLTTYS